MELLYAKRDNGDTLYKEGKSRYFIKGVIMGLLYTYKEE